MIPERTWPSERGRRSWASLLLLLGGVVLFSGLRVGAATRVGTTTCLLVSGSFWFLAIERVGRRIHPRNGSEDRAALLWIFLGWLGLRVPVLLGATELSDDVYRYVWEGRLLAEGTSPYAFSPSSPELEGFRARWPELAELVNHPDVSAVYPPLAELVFAGTTSLVGRDGDPRDSIRAFRGIFTAFDLGVLVLLLAWLRRKEQPLLRAAVWAWCPLVALEFAGSAHFDVLAIALFVAGVLLLEGHERAEEPRGGLRQGAALALFCAGALVKLLPAAMVPFALRGRRSIRSISAAIVMLVLLLAPLAFLQGGFSGLDRGVSEYAFRWESFNLVHRWIEGILDPFFARDEGGTDPRRLARSCAIVAWILVAAWVWRSRFGPGRAGRGLVAGFLILTPTLHPWYLTWIVPFLACHPSRAWTFLLAVAPVLYWPLTEWEEERIWREPGWMWPAVALPFFMMFAAETIHRRRRPKEGNA